MFIFVSSVCVFSLLLGVDRLPGLWLSCDSSGGSSVERLRVRLCVGEGGLVGGQEGV